jgi:hypothetical protein
MGIEVDSWCEELSFLEWQRGCEKSVKWSAVCIFWFVVKMRGGVLDAVSPPSCPSRFEGEVAS